MAIPTDKTKAIACIASIKWLIYAIEHGALTETKKITQALRDVLETVGEEYHDEEMVYDLVTMKRLP